MLERIVNVLRNLRDKKDESQKEDRSYFPSQEEINKISKYECLEHNDMLRVKNQLSATGSFGVR